jgi:hypothetical protein
LPPAWTGDSSNSPPPAPNCRMSSAIDNRTSGNPCSRSRTQPAETGRYEHGKPRLNSRTAGRPKAWRAEFASSAMSEAYSTPPASIASPQPPPRRTTRQRRSALERVESATSATTAQPSPFARGARGGRAHRAVRPEPLETYARDRGVVAGEEEQAA